MIAEAIRSSVIKKETLKRHAVRSSIRNRLGLRVVRRMLEGGPDGFTGGGRSTRHELGGL